MELFGSVPGAFAGAADKPGLFELASRGTLFLDDLGALPLSAQLGLLRALTDRVVERAGEQAARPIDVRVLAAAGVDLRERVKAGLFREDLYYRLNVFTIHLPPLRRRKEDIPLLAYHFLQKYGPTPAATSSGSAPRRCASSGKTPGPATCASSRPPSSTPW